MTPHPSRPLRSAGPQPLLACVLLTAVALGTGSCSTSATGTGPATVWSADVRAIAPDGAQGTLGVVSQFGETRASMALASGEPGTTYAWRMAQGGCGSEGEIVGGRAAYPVLVADSAGGAATEATLPGQLTSGGSYAARILQEDGAGAEQVVACGVMKQTR